MPALGGGGLGGIALPLVFAWGSTAWEPPFTTLTADLTTGATTIAVAYDLPVYSVPFDVVIGLEMLTVTARPTATSWTVTRGARGSSTLPAADRVHFAGARVSGIPHTIVVTKGATTWDYTAICGRSLRTREISPGGELEATWELDTFAPSSWLPDLDSLVQISDESGVYWSGLIARPGIVSKDQNTGACHLTIVARGYLVTANWDGYEDSRVFNAYSQGAYVVKTARDERCPFISTANTYVTDGTQQIEQAIEGVGSTPHQLWDQICAVGDGGASEEPLGYYVRTADDGMVYLHLVKYSNHPTIRIPWATLKDVPLDWDSELQRTKVVIKWQKGYTKAVQPGATVTRWVYKDYSSQIDNLALADKVAKQILANTALAAAIAGKPLVIEWPKEVYDADDVAIPIWRIRAGWMVELDGITAWNPNLPIPILQIEATDCDHYHHRNQVSLVSKNLVQLGSHINEDLNQQAQYTAQEAGLLGSPVSGIIPQFVVPPEGISTPVNTDLVSFGASGRVGADAVIEDFDISTIWVSIDGGGAVIEAGRLPDVPIDIAMRIRGLRLKGHDNDPATPVAGSISVTVGHGSPGVYPSVGTTVATIALTSTFSAVKNLPKSGAEQITEVAPGDYLSVVIAPTPVIVKVASLGILVQRTDGSTATTTGGGPTITTASASRDANNVTTFLVTTDTACRVQIEFGVDTDYGSRSQKTTDLRKVSDVELSGLPVGTHWRVHAWDTDGTEGTPSTDQTV